MENCALSPTAKISLAQAPQTLGKIIAIGLVISTQAVPL